MTTEARKLPLRDIINEKGVPVGKRAKTGLQLQQRQQSILLPQQSQSPKQKQQQFFVREDASKQQALVDGPEAHGVVDIDTGDALNPQMASEYVQPIMEYISSLEQRNIVPDYFNDRKEKENHFRMRSVLVDWLVEIHYRFELLQETLYLTVNLLDRYLAVSQTPKKSLQLVGATTMLIASKYEEMYPPEVGDFVYIADNTYSREEILSMERCILRVLDFNLGHPSPLHFLRRFSKAGQSDAKGHTIAKYLMELTLVSSSMYTYKASEIAGAATYIAREVVGEREAWPAQIQYYAGYTLEEISECIRDLKGVLQRSVTSRHRAVTSKYSKRKFLRISKSAELVSYIENLS
eukprot:m.63521 g.63521  ORF g.63521 m.63521 type:complete len:350 (+) comp8075_c0_seq1:84-1133(+)